MKPSQIHRSIPVINKKKNVHVSSTTSIIMPQVHPTPPKQPVESSIEAETMLNDLQSSLAQFLHNNNNNSNSMISTNRQSITDDEQNKKSLPIIRSISNINNNHTNNEDATKIEPSMRIEWLDDAMKAERKKMIDEDERGISSQQQSIHEETPTTLKRPLVDSNFDKPYNAKKCRR